MRAKILAPVGVLVIAKVFLAQAEAKTNTLRGTIKGDTNGKVALKVVVKKGKPRKVVSIKFTRMDVTCHYPDTAGTSRDEISKTVPIGAKVRRDKGDLFFSVSEGSQALSLLNAWGYFNETGTKAYGVMLNPWEIHPGNSPIDSGSTEERHCLAGKGPSDVHFSDLK